MPRYEATPELEVHLASKVRYSPSRMLTFMKCPAYFQFRYLMPQVDEPKPVNLFMGSAVHKIVEMAYEHKINTGILPTEEEMIAAHEELWRNAKDEIAEDMIGEIKTAEMQSQKMIKTYLKERAPLIDPIETEAEHYYEIPGREYYIHGIIDLVAAHKPKTPIKFTDGTGKEHDEASLLSLFTKEADNPIVAGAKDQGILWHNHSNSMRIKRIQDIKTIARTPSMDIVANSYAVAPDYEFQLAWYALMITEGRHDLPVCLDYITKAATPKCMEAAIDIPAARCKLILNTIDMIHQSIQTNLFFPNRTSKFCGPNCDFWDTCHQKHG